MSQPLDLDTVLQLHRVSFLVGALCFLYVRSRSPGSIGLGVLSSGFFLVAMATAGTQLSVYAPDFTTQFQISGFFLGLCGYAVFDTGIYRVSGRQRQTTQWFILLFPVATTLLMVLSGAHVVSSTRVSIFNVAAAALLLDAALRVYTDETIEPLPVRMVLSITIAMTAFLSALVVVGIQMPSIAIIVPRNAFFLSIICHFAIAVFVMALVKERAEESLHRLADLDALTGVANRRSFFTRLPEALRSGDAVVMIDIDHFKKINDNYGHLAGDDVLATVAHELSVRLGPNDLFARYGGEEFVLFLPSAGKENAVATAERLRAEVSAVPHVIDGQDVTVTISMGLAVCEEKVAFAKLLLKKADIALYASKAAGRDRLSIHQSGDIEVLVKPDKSTAQKREA